MSFVRGHWKERPRKRDLLLCPGLGGVPGSFIGTETAFRDTRLKPFLPLCSHGRKESGRQGGQTTEGPRSQTVRAENQPLIQFPSTLSNNSLDPKIRGQRRGPGFFQGLPARAHWGIPRKGRGRLRRKKALCRSRHPTGPERDECVHVPLSVTTARD